MRRHFTAYILAAFASIFLTAQTNAQICPYVLDRDYEIFVSLPESYSIKNDSKKETTKPNAPKAYPVMFVTDANYAFPLLRSINRRVADHGENLQEFILVALSCAKGDDPAFSRNRDYTPTDIDRRKTRAIDQNGEVYGQAKKYRRYVAEEVFPYVAQHFRADMKRFERQLKSHRCPDLSVQSEVIADEDHLTVAPTALTRGVLWAFGKP